MEQHEPLMPGSTSNNRIKLTPAQTLILTWSSVIFIGAFLLMLPISRLKPLSFVDALFTSASSVCVTGLMTVNISGTFTVFGQVVILFLIQIGGIGIIAAGTFFMLLLGRAVPMNDWSTIRNTYTSSKELSIRRLIIKIIIMVFCVEAVGTLVLTLIWSGRIGFTRALYSGLFHSVSAFNNAGISILPDGLYGMEKTFAADLTVTVLIILGGLGFVTITELISFGKRGPHRKKGFSLQTRIILFFTFLLISVGTICFFIFEYNHALAGKPIQEQLMVSFFQSVSARTAGFANIHIDELNNESIYTLLLLMFVGGAPGSTAGGIKITALAAMIAIVLSRYKGHDKANIFKRTIPETIVSHAITIISIATLVVIFFTFILLVTEYNPVSGLGDERGEFLKMVFEAVSALGTVGLSLGETPLLSLPGKIAIIMLMLIGRLGPLTVIMAIRTSKSRSAYHYAEENIMVG